MSMKTPIGYHVIKTDGAPFDDAMLNAEITTLTTAILKMYGFTLAK